VLVPIGIVMTDPVMTDLTADLAPALALTDTTDLAAEPAVSAWDVAAAQVLVEQAGGRFTDLDGVARHDGGTALSSNGLLHDTALALLRP
jgi:histidinol-phosphatase